MYAFTWNTGARPMNLNPTRKLIMKKYFRICTELHLERHDVCISPLEIIAAEVWKCASHPFSPTYKVVCSSSHPCCNLGIKYIEESVSIFQSINIACFPCPNGTTYFQRCGGKSQKIHLCLSSRRLQIPPTRRKELEYWMTCKNLTKTLNTSSAW